MFSTKDRTASLKADIRTDLFAYMGGIIRSFGGNPVIINGVADHVHLLFSIPATIAVAEAMRIIKAKSSRWMRGRDRSFAWQPGYAGFSVSQRFPGFRFAPPWATILRRFAATGPRWEQS